MNNKYTSPELSKKLNENGCKLEGEMFWHGDDGNDNFTLENYKDPEHYPGVLYRAYDILNDICVKYAKEFFG